ncbi:MAG: PAS domain S-box protein, partial [Bacteroidetes bacterium]|nr:PAS domain S-box protein [Bacteroidota bacterium]
NPAFYTAFPWISSGTPGKPSPHEFFTRASGDFLKELFYQPAQPQTAGKSLTRNITLQGSGGEARVIEVHAVVRAELERNTYHFWFFDVTRQAEAFNELKDSQEFYRSLLDSSAGAVALVRGGRFEYVNRGLMEMFGYMVLEEVVGREVTDFVLAREKKLLTQKMNPKSRTAGAVDRFEFPGIRKDRAKVYVQAFAESVTIGGKESTLLYLRDKTGEVEAEETRRRKEREQVSLDRITHAIHRSVELLEVFSASLQTSVEQLGFDGGGVYTLDEDTVGLTLATYQGLTDNLVEKLGKQTIHDGVTGYLAKTLEPVILSIADYPPYLPYKSLFESEGFRTVAYVPLLAWEALAGILFLCSRKSPDHFSFSPDLLATIAQHSGSSIQNARHFERVRASELRYRSAVESAPDVVYQANPNGTLIFMSPQVESLVGYNPSDFIRNPDAWRSIVHPDDRAEYSRRISMQMQKADTVEIQYRVLPKGKAAYRWVRDGVRYTRDANGQVTRISGIVTDITAGVERDAAPSESQ